jgi:signal transduction histidine kinase
MVFVHLKLFFGSRNNIFDAKTRNQIKYIWLGFIVFTPAVIDFIPNYGMDIYPAGFLFVLGFACVSAYAIARYQLMDVKIIIKKTVFYSLLTVLVSTAYVALIFLFHYFYSGKAFRIFSLIDSLKASSENIKLTPYFYSLSLTTLASFFLSIFVLIKNSQSKIARLWSIGCLCCGIWSLAFNIMIHVNNYNLGYFFANLSNLTAALMCVVVAHFCKEISNYKSKINILFLGYLNTVFFILTALTGHFMTVRPIMNFNYFPSAKPIYSIYTIHFFFFLFFGIYCLLKGMKTASIERRNQMKYIIVALAAGYFAGITTFLPAYGLKIDPFPGHFVWLYAIIITFAILKHQLMDIRVIIRKTLFFTLFTIFISVLSLAVVLLTHSLIAESKTPTSSFIANFAGILFIAIMFKPFELFFQKKLEKRFFKGTVSEVAEQNERLALELERTERLKSVGILAAGMAHEIKNPLTAIKTFSEFLPKRFEDSVFREKFIKIINDETDRISAIVGDLLIFSKPVPPKKQICNCLEILKGITDLLSGTFLKNNIITEYEIASDKNKALVDPSQIKQALLNIVLNAIDAMKERGGKLNIQLTSNEHCLIVKISDTGKGIPTEKLKYLFDPFYTTKDDGTGLGLAITHTLVQANSGKALRQGGG